MNVAELKAKIATDHERLRELQGRIASGPVHERRKYDALIKQAEDEITKMKITLAGMSSACPACKALIPHHFFICLVCLREVPFKLWAAFKGAACMHHAGHAHEDQVSHTRAAVLAHLKQFGTALS